LDLINQDHAVGGETVAVERLAYTATKRTDASCFQVH
jgi:hypothetical protein